ncbi:MAG: hypothetical protein P4L49_06170 [Desulfosporosinus sp.]|nr:hypothetical protein [Desulfosporosinus sp.]
MDSLVSSGTLDKVQEETIKSAIPTTLKNGMAKGEFNRGQYNGQAKNVLDGLVKAGTITQAQEDSIQGS